MKKLKEKEEMLENVDDAMREKEKAVNQVESLSREIEQLSNVKDAKVYTLSDSDVMYHQMFLKRSLIICAGL